MLLFVPLILGITKMMQASDFLAAMAATAAFPRFLHGEFYVTSVVPHPRLVHTTDFFKAAPLFSRRIALQMYRPASGFGRPQGEGHAFARL